MNKWRDLAIESSPLTFVTVYLLTGIFSEWDGWQRIGFVTWCAMYLVAAGALADKLLERRRPIPVDARAAYDLYKAFPGKCSTCVVHQIGVDMGFEMKGSQPPTHTCDYNDTRETKKMGLSLKFIRKRDVEFRSWHRVYHQHNDGRDVSTVCGRVMRMGEENEFSTKEPKGELCHDCAKERPWKAGR